MVYYSEQIWAQHSPLYHIEQAYQYSGTIVMLLFYRRTKQ